MGGFVGGVGLVDYRLQWRNAGAACLQELMMCVGEGPGVLPQGLGPRDWVVQLKE